MADNENPEEVAPASQADGAEAPDTEAADTEAADTETADGQGTDIGDVAGDAPPGGSGNPPAEVPGEPGAPVEPEVPLAPRRAAKLAGIGVLAALLVAVIVVAAVWAVSAITDESDDDEYVYDEYRERRDSYDDEYRERRDSDDGWLEYLDPSDFDGPFDRYRRGQWRGLFGHGGLWGEFWDRGDGRYNGGDHFEGRESPALRGALQMPFALGAGPVVVVVPGGWSGPGGLDADGSRLELGAILRYLLPLAEGDGSMDELGPELAELLQELFGEGDGSVGELGPGLAGLLEELFAEDDGSMGELGPELPGLLAELFAEDESSMDDLGPESAGLLNELLDELFAQGLFNDPSVLEGLFGTGGLLSPDPPDEASLDGTEPDTPASAALEESAPT